MWTLVCITTRNAEQRAAVENGNSLVVFDQILRFVSQYNEDYTRNNKAYQLFVERKILLHFLERYRFMRFAK